jgi:two-component system response regulator AtoC
VRRRLLVVDDDVVVRRAYRAHFSARGYEVRAARGPGEAAALLAKRRFDAVILDVCLSRDGIEGLALAGGVRERRARPVLVLTAYGVPLVAGAAARLGADLFLHKPVSLIWLEHLLCRRIERRRRASAARGAH